MACFTLADPDLWGHLRFGLDIVHIGHVSVGRDPYSFTQDRPFIYHEWLGGTIMALAYRFGGVSGLILLKAVLVGAAFTLVWGSLRRTPFRWRWGGLAIAAIGGLLAFVTVRPQLWTMIAMVGVCRILTSSSRNVVWWLPPIFAAWANLHGGWVLGGAIVALWTGIAIVQRREGRWKLLMAGIVSLAATLLNPYGVDLWMFLATTVRVGRERITEWQPIWRAGVPAVVLWLLPVATILVSMRRRGRPALGVLLTLVFLAYASANVLRLVSLFALSTVTLLSSDWPKENVSRRFGAGASHGFLVLCVGVIVFGVTMWAHWMPSCIRMGVGRTYPGLPDTVVAESLRGTEGRLVTAFDWGEYVIWHFGPNLQVSIDGRRETLYSDRMVDEQEAIRNGTPVGLSALARLNPEYVWLPSSSQTTARWLTAHGYREDVRSGASFIAVRSDLPPLRAWNGVPSGCFPGP